MEALCKNSESLDLKDWLQYKYSGTELDEMYLRCVISSGSVHSIFLDLLQDGYNIEVVSVASVVSAIRDIHSEKAEDNK